MERNTYADHVKSLRYALTGCCRFRPDIPVNRLLSAVRGFMLGCSCRSAAIALDGIIRTLYWQAMIALHAFRELSILLAAALLLWWTALMPRVPTSSRRRLRTEPSLRRICRFADFLPLKSRRAVKAMAGDYEIEIRRMRRERRPIAARWNVCIAWWTALYIAFRTPIVSFGMLVVGKITSMH